MNIELKGKTAVVTGSTQGIGMAIARGLASAGAELIINGRGQEDVQNAVVALTAELPNARVLGVAADLGTAEGCRALASAVPRCDILALNAAIFRMEDFFEISDATWQQYLDVNLMAGVRLSRAYLPGMAERKWGRVVFIGSECAISTPPDMIHYATTKTAGLGLSRALAKRMAGTGVTVNSVLPGPTLTEGVRGFFEEETKKTGKSVEELGAEFVMKVRPSSITQRFQSAEEVANLVIYTCSSQASGTTGTALRVDGGVADCPI